MEKIVYGPVPSWRLGRSLGIDLISSEKTCTFNCTYCQLGETKRFLAERHQFVPTEKVVAELKNLPEMELDYITFSGMGEPTLASNLGEVIWAIKAQFNTPVAVLTNSSLMHREDVYKELVLADLVVAKLDAPNDKLFQTINRPLAGISFQKVLKAINRFSRQFPGKLALQIMFIPQNKDYVVDLAGLAAQLAPVEVQINTPLRPSPIKPLPPEELKEIAELFMGLNTVCVYGARRLEVVPLDAAETQWRRPEGKFEEL